MRFFRKYIMPGFIFQSVVIGGGYATGRELIEFFFSAGPIGGVLGLLVSGLIFGAVLATGFELARVTRTYDYRHFCRQLLGKGWFVFEIVYVVQLLLVLSVIGSASGSIITSTFDLPPLVGTLSLMALIGILTFKGTKAIELVLSWWSVLLYTVYIILFVLAFKYFGDVISNTYANASIGEGWLSQGILYSGYNLAILPAILFVVSDLDNRRETVGAGFMAGLIAVVPAILFYIAMMGKFPEISEQPVPATYLMSALDVGWLNIIFQFVIFGTFVETGTALLHAVNERLEGSYADRGKSLPRYVRPLVAIGFLSLAIFAADKFGIVSLIAQGYSILTLVFIVILILPLMTFGVWKIMQQSAA